jgi:peptidyl-dipeptidase A
LRKLKTDFKNIELFKKCKASYEEFVKVSNKAAVLNDYTDTGDSWRDWYEDPNFEKLVDDIWVELKPLYSKIHGHIR